MTRKSRDARMTALEVLGRLRAAGHVALLAGGCVRDQLLHRVPKDYDIATDAIPEQVLKLFPRARRVGAKFGVVLVRRYGQDIEVATFRADGNYSDGRHPDVVRFGDQVEDAQRRDFTINGLFFDPMEDRIIDHVAGRADLQARVIRTIGDPARRFAEDHLRMLRAVRFAARFGFRIESDTMTAIQCHAEHLKSISAERIWQELDGILTAPTRVYGWTLLLETGLRSHLQNDWKSDPLDDEVVRRRLLALPTWAISSDLALAAAWGSYSQVDIDRVSKGLRLANRLAKAVKWLVESLEILRECRSIELAELKLLMANESWNDLLELLRVDLAATESNLHRFEEIREWAAGIPRSTIAPPPLLSGNDLLQMGIAAGPRMGWMLDEIYRAQLNGVIATKNQARKLIRHFEGRR